MRDPNNVQVMVRAHRARRLRKRGGNGVQGNARDSGDSDDILNAETAHNARARDRERSEGDVSAPERASKSGDGQRKSGRRDSEGHRVMTGGKAKARTQQRAGGQQMTAGGQIYI
jgi:hypothetical protein